MVIVPAPRQKNPVSHDDVVRAEPEGPASAATAAVIAVDTDAHDETHETAIDRQPATAVDEHLNATMQPEDDASSHIEAAVEEDAYDVPKPRRRLKIVTGIGAAVVLAAAGGAGLLMSQQTPEHPDSAPTLKITIPDRPTRQRTADGQDVITTTAKVMNTGTATGRMPELKATMRTPDGRVVKEWKVTSPPGSIAPRDSRTVQIGTAGAQVPQGPLTLDVDMIERDGR